MTTRKSILIIFTLLFALRLQAAQNKCAEMFASSQQERVVKIENNQIVVDGEAQPQLYGAEFQYFRLRGAYGKNVPRAQVIATWKRGLRQMVRAGMNSISFYIPWDFHEYAPGKFDFTGTIDEDGDGKPDYPSRDILTFLKLVQESGIKRILLRPGPYINAEWGFLGFGAVPEWFHNQYPNSHMQNAKGFKSRLYDYHNPDFLRHTKLWFEELNHQVLSHVIGKGKPALFLQLDNETNFQWQSIYNHDYGPNAVARYQQFLKNRYRNLAAINREQHTSAKSWKDVTPPTEPGKNLVQDSDWYRFQDWSIYSYLQEIRKIWGEVGVHEPNVIFTLAESFNAAENGLLPNYKYRNAKNKTGLMTINVYSKTSPAPANVLLHQPFKADHDVIAAAAANRHYLGRNEEAVIGPEIHTGWFDPTVVIDEARQQSYLTLIGRGLKAQFLYYFNEGYNWNVEWSQNQILPYYQDLHSELRYEKISQDQLPDSFWSELQNKVDQDFMAGWDVKKVILQDSIAAQKLSFGAPLDGDAKPTKHFKLVAEIGQKIVQPYGEYLSRTLSIRDKVAILTDSGAVTPSSIPGINSLQMHSDFVGGLLGYIQQTGLNPSIHHWGINSNRELAQNKIIFVQDSGNLNPHMVQWLAKYAANGGTVVSFIGDSVARQIGAPTTQQVNTLPGAITVTYQSPDQGAPAKSFEALGASLSEYSVTTADAQTQPILYSNNHVIGYKFKYQKGSLVQIGAIFHDAFNADAYAFLTDVPQRRALLDELVLADHIQPQFSVVEGGDRIVAFGRKAPADENLWLTVKSAHLNKVNFHIRIHPNLLRDQQNLYDIKDVMKGTSQTIDRTTLISSGLAVKLGPNGSTAFFISPHLEGH